jgi:hypothetical protein
MTSSGLRTTGNLLGARTRFYVDVRACESRSYTGTVAFPFEEQPWRGPVTSGGSYAKGTRQLRRCREYPETSRVQAKSRLANGPRPLSGLKLSRFTAIARSECQYFFDLSQFRLVRTPGGTAATLRAIFAIFCQVGKGIYGKIEFV